MARLEEEYRIGMHSTQMASLVKSLQLTYFAHVVACNHGYRPNTRQLPVKNLPERKQTMARETNNKSKIFLAS